MLADMETRIMNRLDVICGIETRIINRLDGIDKRLDEIEQSLKKEETDSIDVDQTSD